MHSFAGILLFEIFKATLDGLFRVFEGKRIGLTVNRGRSRTGIRNPHFPVYYSSGWIWRRYRERIDPDVTTYVCSGICVILYSVSER